MSRCSCFSLPALHNLARAVDIGEEEIECGDALLQAALKKRPFLCVDNAGNDVERDEALGIAAFGVDREGDADAAEQPLGLFSLGVKRFRRGLRQPRRNCGIGRAELAIGAVHLIEKLAHCCVQLATRSRALASATIGYWARGAQVSGAQTDGAGFSGVAPVPLFRVRVLSRDRDFGEAPVLEGVRDRHDVLVGDV